MVLKKFVQGWQVWHGSSYNQLTNREIITVKHKAYLLLYVLACLCVWAAERQRKKRGIGRWGHKAPNIHLSLTKMKIVQSTQRAHLMHPSLFCFFGAGSDSDLDFMSFFFPLRWIEFQTSEAVAWWSLTLREPFSVIPVTQSLKSPNERKNKKERRGGAVYDIALQWAPEKRKISINFTTGCKSG